MNALRISILAAAMAGIDVQMAMASQQSEAQGLLEDSRMTLTNRNYYYNHDSRDGAQDRRDWAQAMLLNYRSGFTQGTVGFGVDAFANGVLKLDEQGDGFGNVAIDNDGDSDSFSHVGGAVKLRVSNTVLKYGIVQPVAPVFAAGGSRILPQSVQGFLLQSAELDGLSLQGGHFTAATGYRGSSNHDPIKSFYTGIEADSVDYLGGDYRVSDNLSVALYAGRFEDIWRQYYGGANYTLPIGEQSLNLSFNLYRSQDEGRALVGAIDNTAWSLAAAYTLGAHRLTLAWQQIHGDEPFDYAGFGAENSGGDSIYLANSVQYSDFNGPNEKSAQIRYDLDLASLGVPGLSFMTRYLYGYDIDGSDADASGAYAGMYAADDKEREIDIELKYVVQSGPAKDLTLRARQMWHRGDASTGGDLDQIRLMFEYPLDIL